MKIDFTKEDLLKAIKEIQLQKIEKYKDNLLDTNKKYFYEDLTAVCLWWLEFDSRKRLKLARELERDGLIGLSRINKRQHNSPLQAYIINIENQAS